MKLICILLFIFSFQSNCFAQEKDISENDVLESYPYAVNYFLLDIQKEKLQMAYMDVKSPKSNGKTILLLHGKNFCGAYWDKTIERLTSLGYRVVVPDQIGFGKSTRPQNMQYSFYLLAKNTKSLLDNLGITSAIVIGHSMGGMLATRLALMYPDYFQKVILECPIGLRNYDKNKSYETIDELYHKELQQDYNKIKKYHLETYYHNEWKGEYERWVKLLALGYSGSGKNLTAWNSAKIFDMINTQPIVFELPGIKIPALYISGELDPMVPPVDSLSTMINKGGKGKSYFQYEILPGIGHIPHIETFDIFMKKVEVFLSE